MWGFFIILFLYFICVLNILCLHLYCPKRHKNNVLIHLDTFVRGLPNSPRFFNLKNYSYAQKDNTTIICNELNYNRPHLSVGVFFVENGTSYVYFCHWQQHGTAFTINLN